MNDLKHLRTFAVVLVLGLIILMNTYILSRDENYPLQIIIKHSHDYEMEFGENSQSGSNMLIDQQFMRLVNLLVKNESKASYISFQILPIYSPQTYSTPIEVDWFSYANYERKRQHQNWTRQMSNEDHSTCMDLLRMMHEILSQGNISYSLTHGTLLGSYRHMDIVPWDDDVDIIIDSVHREAVKELISKTRLDLGFVTVKHYIKIFQKSSPGVTARLSKYPFVDVFFYSKNHTHLFGSLWGANYAFRSTDFFPLKLRPFGKYWLPTPYNPSKVLEGIGIRDFRAKCIMAGFDHKAEKKRKVLVSNCSQLSEYHLFTEERCIQEKSLDFCCERLEINKTKTVHLFDYVSSSIAVIIRKNTS